MNGRATKEDLASVLFFAEPADFRRWLAKNHQRVAEQWVGFYKRGSGRPSITWPQSVDEALCFGWIDGLRKSIDEERYKIRFTPRKPGSIWSAINTRRAAELTAGGRMQPAGLAALGKRQEKRSGVYSFERRVEARLGDAMQARFEAQAKAWRWFQSCPPWYRRAAFHWVVSARKEETRERRFTVLLESSAAGQHVPPLRRPEPKRPG